MGRIFFNLMKERAITTKSPAAVYKLYNQMKNSAENANVSSAQLRQQLKDEYGIDPMDGKDAENDLEPITTEEIKSQINAL